MYRERLFTAAASQAATRAPLDATNAVVAAHMALDIAVAHRRDEITPVLGHLLQDAVIRTPGPRTCGSERVDLAVAAKQRGTKRTVSLGVHVEDLGDGRRGGHALRLVLETVALEEDLGAGEGNIESVAGVGCVPVVGGLNDLDAVGGSDLGGAAGDVVEVVAVECDLV